MFFLKTVLTQSLPSPNFFKPSVPGEVRVFRALRACSKSLEPPHGPQIDQISAQNFKSASAEVCLKCFRCSNFRLGPQADQTAQMHFVIRSEEM